MNAKATIILLIVFAVAAAALLLVDTGDHQNTGTTEDDKNKQAIIDPDTLGPALYQIAFDLDADGEGDDLVLARVQGRWKIEVPHAFPARNSELDKVLKTLAELEGTPTDEATIPSHPIGITIGHGDKRYSLWLGKRLGSGQAMVYRQVQGKTQGYLTTDTLHDLLANLNPSLFYAKSFDPLLMAEIKEVRINTPESEAVLLQDNDLWQIAYGDKTERALTQNIPGHHGVRSYFELFRRVELTEQQAYLGKQELSKFGLDKPLITVRFVPVLEDAGQSETGWVLKVGVPADPDDTMRFVSFGWSGDPTPAVFTVATPYALSFGKDSAAFRDPRIVTTPIALIKSLEMIDPTRPFYMPELEATLYLKSKHVFSFQHDAKARAKFVTNQKDEVDGWIEISERPVKQMVEALVSARAVDYVILQADELKPLKIVRLMPRLGEGIETFRIYTDMDSVPDKPTVLVQREGEPIALRIAFDEVRHVLDPGFLMLAK